ncbi:MAG TPA: hypothetical protein VN577_20225 [Terriglobales bacterium]|nr:hypothetical protein [Terriglobales bacterium]
MRNKLKDRAGRRGRFTAQFSRFGLRRSQWGNTVTALMVDVRDESGDLVTDHLWFKVGKLMRELSLERGDRVEFYATVGAYEKANRDAWIDDDEPRRVTDYCLKRAAGFRKIGKPEATALPLFEESYGEDQQQPAQASTDAL